MDPNMFNDLPVRGLVAFAVFGVVVASIVGLGAVGYGLYWLTHHISIH